MQAMVWSAFNGIGLALVIPCIASLIADYHPPESRGQAFGLMAFTSGLGKIPSMLLIKFFHLRMDAK